MLGRLLFWILSSCLIKVVFYYICSHSPSKRKVPRVSNNWTLGSYSILWPVFLEDYVTAWWSSGELAYECPLWAIDWIKMNKYHCKTCFPRNKVCLSRDLEQKIPCLARKINILGHEFSSPLHFMELVSLNEWIQGIFQSSAEFCFESQLGIHNMEISFLWRGELSHGTVKWLISLLTTIWAVIYGMIHEC